VLRILLCRRKHVIYQMCPGRKPYFGRVLNLNVECQIDKNKLNNSHEINDKGKGRSKSKHSTLRLSTFWQESNRDWIGFDESVALLRHSPIRRKVRRSLAAICFPSPRSSTWLHSGAINHSLRSGRADDQFATSHGNDLTRGEVVEIPWIGRVVAWIVGIGIVIEH
jgi:hypothetical protein